MAMPKNNAQFLQNLKKALRTKYSENEVQRTCANLKKDWTAQGFANYDDVKMDLEGSYANCKSKEIVYSSLGITKEEVFMMLKLCTEGIVVSQNYTDKESVIDRICMDINRYASASFKDKEIADLIVQTVRKVISQHKWEYNKSAVIADLKKKNKGIIINAVYHDLNAKEGISIDHIILVFNHIICRLPGGFDIYKSLDFTINENDVKIAAKLIKDEPVMKSIFTHATANYNADDDSKEMDSDNALCIAKAVDLKNHFPILQSLLYSFCMDRTEKHKQKEQNVKGYDAAKWMNDPSNVYCQWLKKNINPKVFIAIQTALVVLTKRTTPLMNFNYKMCETICDDLNEFAKYTIVSYKVMKHIQGSCDTNQFCPFHIDFWIIPKSVKKPPLLCQIPNWDSDSDDDDDYSDDDNDDNDDSTDDNFKELKKNGVVLKDLAKHLINAGYKAGKDYYVSQIEERDEVTQIMRMIVQHWERDFQGHNVHGKRYICVIDRRVHNDDNDNDDMMYFIKPKVYGDLTKRIGVLSEACFGLSKKFLFPNPNEKEKDIGILDALNGYKFCLSYHLLFDGTCKIYWYLNQGVQPFKLTDMEWLWPRYFQKVKYEKDEETNQNEKKLKDQKNKPETKPKNKQKLEFGNEEQRLNKQNIHEMEQLIEEQGDNRNLCDPLTEEFYKQTKIPPVL